MINYGYARNNYVDTMITNLDSEKNGVQKQSRKTKEQKKEMQV